MQKNLVNSIHNYLFKLTNKKISKKEIEKKIIPIFYFLNDSKKNMFLISGSQGIGKTIMLKILYKNFYKFFGKRILNLSLDDFYYNKTYRKFLSKSIHPLMMTRGVPGTHNTKEILDVIKRFNNTQYPIKIPIFDKLRDSRNIKKRIITKKSDILILEGWCCGSPPLINKYLYNNINSLEKKFDRNHVWRNYYNKKLKHAYADLFKKFDGLIFFKAPSFSNVLEWRYKQENNMKKAHKKTNICMNKKQIYEFIQHYEKITKWMMKILPTKADLTVYVDKNQKIKKISSV